MTLNSDPPFALLRIHLLGAGWDGAGPSATAAVMRGVLRRNSNTFQHWKRTGLVPLALSGRVPKESTRRIAWPKRQ
eukprot:scaffold6931_cov443-Prasinococcus_capsulatus_cf.AAC.6